MQPMLPMQPTQPTQATQATHSMQSMQSHTCIDAVGLDAGVGCMAVKAVGSSVGILAEGAVGLAVGFAVGGQPSTQLHSAWSGRNAEAQCKQYNQYPIYTNQYPINAINTTSRQSTNHIDAINLTNRFESITWSGRNSEAGLYTEPLYTA